MNYLYKYPLFERKDHRRAFNYLFANNESDTIDYYFRDEYMHITETASVDGICVTANMKKIEDIACSQLLPQLTVILNLVGQKHDYVIFNPNMILNARNPFCESTIDKILPYISDEMFNMSMISIRFDGFVNKDLEQIIKSKYSEYILQDEKNRTYVKLGPMCDFSMLYDFIDDILHNC